MVSCGVVEGEGEAIEKSLARTKETRREIPTEMRSSRKSSMYGELRERERRRRSNGNLGFGR